MKRPQTRAGVGKPTPKPGARGAANTSARDTGKILASVTAIGSAKSKPAAPATPAKPAKPLKLSKQAKLSASAEPAARVRAPKAQRHALGAPAGTRARAGKLFERLGPEAAKFRSYSRQRRAILISIVGSFTALILLMLASMYTPMLAVQEIRVTGLDRLKPAQIQAALKPQLGTPLPMVNADKIGEELKNFSLIESFAITSRPPHTLVVRITERSPICVVSVDGKQYLYDPAGVRVGDANGSDQYPLLTINDNPSNSAEFKLAIDVLLALPASLLPRVYAIDAKTKDNVTMQLRGNAGQAIVWGDSSNSALKSKVLAALIHNYKKGDRVTFDVSSPTAPAVRY